MTTLSSNLVACFFLREFRSTKAKKFNGDHGFEFYTFINTPQNDNVIISQERETLMSRFFETGHKHRAAVVTTAGLKLD